MSKFGETVICELNALYSNGMVGIGTQYDPYIQLAIQRTNLTEAQVKSWIRRKTFHMKHLEKYEIPRTKRRINKWQQHLKNFANSECGKAETDLAEFNKKAQQTYSAMSIEEKEKLHTQAEENSKSTVYISKKKVKKEGRKIFEKMLGHLKQLEELGYHAFIFGTFDGNIELEHTKSISCCFTQSVLSYLHALIVAANPPNIPKELKLQTQEHSNPDENTVTDILNTSSQEHSNPEENTVTDILNTSSQEHSNPEENTVTDILNTSSQKHSNPEENTVTSVLNTSSQLHSNDDEPEVQPQSTSKRKRKRRITNSEKSKLSKLSPRPWISEINLFEFEKQILLSPKEWLNDNIMNASQTLLQKLSQSIKGFQNTQMGKGNRFKPIDIGEKFVQILHVNSNHWITVSNVLHCINENQVVIYDSMYTGLSLSTKLQICSLLKQHKLDSVKFSIANMVQQKDSFTCGLFSIAVATDLCFGFDPLISQWHIPAMRTHLYQCLARKDFASFPKNDSKKGNMKTFIREIEEKIYCVCREVNDTKKAMVYCKDCRLWYHIQCVGLTEPLSFDFVWKCDRCKLN